MGFLDDLSDFGRTIFYCLMLLIGYALICYVKNNRVKIYYVEPSPLDPNFVDRVIDILSKSVINRFHPIRVVYDPEEADITLHLRKRADLNKHHRKPEFYPSGKQIRFSLTFQDPKPHVLFDSENWLHGVEESGLSLNDYRRYVVQHEFMHALGYDHQKCDQTTSNAGVCPVLYQATRGPPTGYASGFNPIAADFTKRIPGNYFDRWW